MSNWSNESEAREQIKTLVAEYYKDFKSGEYSNTTVVTVGQSQGSSQDGETVPADISAADEEITSDTGNSAGTQNTSE